MTQMNYFSLVFGILIGCLGIVGVVFADEFRVGIVSPLFRPSKLVRASVAVILVSVAFGFIYTGLGSPPRLLLVDRVGSSVVDIFVVVLATLSLFQLTKNKFQSGEKSARSKFKSLAFALAVTVFAMMAILDLISRHHR